MDKNKLLPPTENSIGRRPESFQTDVYDVPAPSITDDATMLGTIEETRAIATTEVNVLIFQKDPPTKTVAAHVTETMDGTARIEECEDTFSPVSDDQDTPLSDYSE
ncbi:hypothetical protein E4U54_001681 [Claviceps lovelessii]|nr:hypothetical protein E4U54_001681 [Claviceps lovelessii]